jgi:hypothetical protein
VFEDAVRPATNALIAPTGPASSGKTCSPLAMATGMGTNTGVIDTERGRASHYAGIFPSSSTCGCPGRSSRHGRPTWLPVQPVAGMDLP